MADLPHWAHPEVFRLAGSGALKAGIGRASPNRDELAAMALILLTSGILPPDVLTPETLKGAENVGPSDVL